jgi:hypothetical protein
MIRNTLEANTIFGAAFDSLRRHPGASTATGFEALQRAEDGPRSFKIRAADTAGHRSCANILVKRRYAWRGYQSVSIPDDPTGSLITLNATESDATIGTITIGLDGPRGLLAEDTFPDEVARLRATSRRICEFTKLAMDPTTGAKQVLASLFHVAYIVAHRLRGCDMLLMEVNPRHVAYYRRMLGCQVLAAERTNRRVNAPAVLLCLDFAYTREQIGRFAGQPERAATERTLYPYSFSLAEEAGIICRLRDLDWL